MTLADLLITYAKDIISFVVLLGSFIGGIAAIKNEIKSGFKKHDEELDKKIDALSQENIRQNEENSKRFADLEKKIDNNERDRLRQEIFRAAADCRHGMYLSGEQFSFLRDQVVKKYHSLGGNSVGDKAWEYICDYYYKQCHEENAQK